MITVRLNERTSEMILGIQNDITEAVMKLGRPRKNVQIVVLLTDDGTARNDEQIKEVWQKRLQECGATHYKIVSAKIIVKEAP